MKILITGVSSGIGRTLTKQLISNGSKVWGIARRKKLLLSLLQETDNSPNLYVSTLDVSLESDWKKLLKRLIEADFMPDVIIFNAVIWEKDLAGNFDIESTKKMINTNFYGALYGVNLLLPLVNKGTQFIAISSLSVFQGSETVGIGYSAGKAGLSIAFECLHQKYKDKFSFKTIFFGPLDTKLNSFKKNPPFLLTKEQASKFIIDAINSRKIIFYRPKILFFFYWFIKLLPSNFYFKLLAKHEILRRKYR